jgi:hypothetical protein
MVNASVWDGAEIWRLGRCNFENVGILVDFRRLSQRKVCQIPDSAVLPEQQTTLHALFSLVEATMLRASTI